MTLVIKPNEAACNWKLITLVKQLHFYLITVSTVQ